MVRNAKQKRFNFVLNKNLTLNERMQIRNLLKNERRAGGWEGKNEKRKQQRMGFEFKNSNKRLCWVKYHQAFRVDWMRACMQCTENNRRVNEQASERKGERERESGNVMEWVGDECGERTKITATFPFVTAVQWNEPISKPFYFYWN